MTCASSSGPEGLTPNMRDICLGRQRLQSLRNEGVGALRRHTPFLFLFFSFSYTLFDLFDIHSVTQQIFFLASGVCQVVC